MSEKPWHEQRRQDRFGNRVEFDHFEAAADRGGRGRATYLIGPLLISTTVQRLPGPVFDRSVHAEERLEGRVWRGWAIRVKFWRRDANRLALCLAWRR